MSWQSILDSPKLDALYLVKETGPDWPKIMVSSLLIGSLLVFIWVLGILLPLVLAQREIYFIQTTFTTSARTTATRDSV